MSCEDRLPVSRIPFDDWNALFAAVTKRLQTAAAELVGGTKPADPTARRERMKTIVLECVAELEGLQRAANVERTADDELPCSVEAGQQTLPWSDESHSGHATSAAMGVAQPALANNPLFSEQLNTALAEAKRYRQPLAVLQLQIAGCAEIASRHGSDVVNDVLAIIGKRLTRTIRMRDKVGWIGANCFTCLLVDVSGREQLSHLACKLLDSVAEPLQVRTLALTMSPSIGIATWQEGDATAEFLVRTADEAMRRARRDRLGYAFSDERALAWANSSRSALGSNGR
jgi:diguanylate cyclase (GGDEF)-like protein